MIRFFARHPTAANLLMILFFVMGLFNVRLLQRETFPDYADDEVEVSVKYPGATAQEVNDAICLRIEDAVDTVNYVNEIRSEAKEGIGTVTLEMEEGEDFQTFIDDIRREVEAIDDFPDITEKPIIKELGRTEQVISIAVTAPMSTPDLKTYCEDLKDILQQKKTISIVDILGFSDRQIRITIPSQTLMQYGLSIADISRTITNESFDLPLGTIETSNRDILLRLTDERTTVEEFKNLIVVAGKNGAEIRLGDIARIEDTFEDEENKILLNGRRCGVLQITKTTSQDSLRIMKDIRDFLDHQRAIQPPSVTFTLTQDMVTIIEDRLSMLIVNGIQGLLLVFLTMWLFFQLRYAFWVVMGLPVAFLGALFFLPYLGLSINMITMVGLLLATGLLMDDAIVISENIAAHITGGKSALDAVVDGCKEVKNGVLSSYATTVLIFGPLTFLSGQIGKVLRVMPVVLILVLTVSLIEAFWILPHHLAHALRHGTIKPQGKFKQKFERGFSWVRDVLIKNWVAAVIRWRYVFASIIAAIFIVSVGMIISGNLKFQAFPEIEGNVLEARILLPQGTPLARTEAIAAQVTDALERVNETFKPRQPGNKDLVKSVLTFYNKNRSANEQGAHVATVSVDLLDAEIRNARFDDIKNTWSEYIGTVPDVLSIIMTEPAIGPSGLPIDIRLKSKEYDGLKQPSLDMQNWLKQFNGVFYVIDDMRPGKPELNITMREEARSLGISAAMVADQLRTAFYGKISTEIQRGEESFEIFVRFSESDRNSVADLDYFFITLPDGKQVPIDTVANIDKGRGWAHIGRVDRQYTVNIEGDLDQNKVNAAQIINKMQKEFLPAFKDTYPDIDVSITGQSEEAAITAQSMKRGFIFGLIGMFILLSFQFRSYKEPVAVMLAIPLALIGVVWGHVLMGLELSLPSMVGFVSLAGIVVNDSILVIEFIKLRLAEGKSFDEAIPLASRDRFRAVTITSLTTIAGLLPLLTEKSLQAQILIPLATSIVFGLLATTLLVLFVIPSLYHILHDMKLDTASEED